MSLDYFSPQSSSSSAEAQSTPVGTPADGGEGQLISMSTMFYPRAQLNALPPDLVVISADEVFFYVHLHILSYASVNNFGQLLPIDTKPAARAESLHILKVPEHSVKVNVLLHIIYGISCEQYSPIFETVVGSVDVMKKYGIPVERYGDRGAPLFSLLLNHAPVHPIEAYAVAAGSGLEDLAIAISPHLLSYDMAQLSDELALRMGAVYLRRLVALHDDRMDVLRKLILSPPQPHSQDGSSAVAYCDNAAALRAWAQAAEELAWEARPGMPNLLFARLDESADCIRRHFSR
ncbi:hypothetical protein PHLCEN_2v6703 [Hermanssonia centrifuga]|uniref:BTB domain-containing protein n=1 Tax=Hermanssonia centrifuga TaxID=98765 RepID=A0A2R6NYN2_9APHY|nr:hypothetical protein PHLCEN_2v6703 [Hermanssonia centrifuga]